TTMMPWTSRCNYNRKIAWRRRREGLTTELLSGPRRLDVKGERGKAVGAHLLAQAEPAVEHLRAQPPGTLAGGHIAALGSPQDVEARRLPSGIDQPVFADAGLGVGLAQDHGVLLHRAVADDLQHHVRRAFQFHVAPSLPLA